MYRMWNEKFPLQSMDSFWSRFLSLGTIDVLEQIKSLDDVYIIGCLIAPLAMPVAPLPNPTHSYDYQKFLQTLPNVFSGANSHFWVSLS